MQQSPQLLLRRDISVFHPCAATSLQQGQSFDSKWDPVTIPSVRIPSLQMGMTITEIHDIEKIDNWFLQHFFMMHTHAVAMQKMQLEQFDYDFFMEAKCL